MMRPPEAEAILLSARALLREQGLSGVTVAALLARSGLGTRAFYRHFTSKDHLLLELFADATSREVERLRALMDGVDGPAAAVAAWVDGRLALAFDDAVESDLRGLSQQAQALYEIEPATMAGLYEELMRPLAEQIEAGVTTGAFVDGDPWFHAELVASVVWACVQREWAAPSQEPGAVRAQALAFCLRALAYGR